MVKESEQRVYQAGSRQAGYITRRQALACGMSTDAINRRVKSKQWARVKPGLYLIQGFDMTWRGQLLAATAALGAIVSHESAAELHDLPWVKRGLLTVTVPIRTTNRFPDVVVHQSTDLRSARVVEFDGLPTTDVVRTVVDLAATRKAKVIGRLLDHIVVGRLAHLDDFVDTVAELSRHGKPGMTTMHRVLEARVGENFIGDSELELLVFRLLDQWGFPRPEMQFPLPWRSLGRGRIDFSYPHLRLIIEVDGRRWHASLEAFEEDRLRDNHAQLAGWRVIRLTYRMLVDQPEQVRRMIAQALAA